MSDAPHAQPADAADAARQTPDHEALSQALQDLMGDAEIWRPRILMSAVRLDVFRALAEAPAAPDALAARIGADPEGTDRLLCALKEMGYVEEGADRRFANAFVSRHFLDPASPYYVGSWFLLNDADWSAWGGLSDAIRTGAPPTGGGVFADPERLAPLLHAAHERARLFHLGEALQALDLRGAGSLLDLGGGLGTYSLAFCETYPDLVCTLFDLPAAIDLARAEIARHPVQDRIRLIAGDFTRDALGGPYDVVFMSNVLHGEPPESAQALVGAARRALTPQGRLVIRDSFLEDDGVNAFNGAIFSLTLMIETEAGRTHKRAAVKDMLARAGFGAIEEPTPKLIVARAG
ncbi:MAG: methyltransferase [Marivibrio sp.]|uniref:class I SAM-dependent methyltransferase n=1 Tax=Marivibrio sp. TaxID=2039719 RepID=UPI0032EC8058